MTPQRIRRKRTRGWQLPPDAVIVDRTSRWGNPWQVGIHAETAEIAVATYRRYLEWFKATDPQGFEEWIAPLRGHDLVCSCKVTDKDGNRVPCHADILLELTNEEEA